MGKRTRERRRQRYLLFLPFQKSKKRGKKKLPDAISKEGESEGRDSLIISAIDEGGERKTRKQKGGNRLQERKGKKKTILPHIEKRGGED